MRILLAFLAFVFAAAASAAPDPLLEKLLAGARATAPATIQYDRATRITTQAAGEAPETHVRSDRWDGRQTTPLTIDGKPATEAQIAESRKATAGKPVAGYHRIGDYLKGGAERISEAPGRTVYRINGLPKGSINIGRDISASLVGEAVVDTSGPQPFVSRLRLFLPKPLSFFMVAKLDSFEVVNDYRLGADSKPALVKAVNSMAGTQFGKTGTTRTEATYTPLR